jgi:hypothetical protein
MGPFTVREGRSATGGERKSYTQKKILFWKRNKKLPGQSHKLAKMHRCHTKEQLLRMDGFLGLRFPRA